jgi:hypothetical protein
MMLEHKVMRAIENANYQERQNTQRKLPDPAPQAQILSSSVTWKRVVTTMADLTPGIIVVLVLATFVISVANWRNGR